MATDSLNQALERIARRDTSPYATARRARVVGLNQSAGLVDALNARYSVDVQLLNGDGSVDENWPQIRDVALPVIWAGNQRGIFALPQLGSVVRMGFYEADPSQPYIDAVLADGHTIPPHPVNSILIQHGLGTLIEISAAGKITIQSSTGVDIIGGPGLTSRVATEAWVHQVFDVHVHASDGLPPTPAIHAGLSHARVSHG